MRQVYIGGQKIDRSVKCDAHIHKRHYAALRLRMARYSWQFSFVMNIT